MKPIKLDMEYFGPFKKESIDFEAVDGQMFLISGRTGSGKTMIFDAITFGLYGQTSTTDRDEDSVRSQFAEDGDISKVRLEFQLGSKRYIVERELSYKKEGRKSRVPSKAALYDEEGGVIESSVTGVTNKIMEIIQLSAEQFRQILILPQGEFKKLLVSTSEEKQKILRTLFQTQRFVQFEMRMRELEKNEQAELHQLEAKITEQLSTLEDSEEHPSFHHRLDSLKNRITETRCKTEALEGDIKAARKKRNVLQDALKEKTAHNDKVGRLEQLYAVQRELESRVAAIRQMETEIADYNRVNAISFELRREAELDRQLKQAGEREATLGREHDSIRSEYDALQEELSALLSNEEAMSDMERFITRNERFLNDRYERLPAHINRLKGDRGTLQDSKNQLNDEKHALDEELRNITVSSDDMDALTNRKHELEMKRHDLQTRLENEEKNVEYDQKIEAVKKKLEVNTQEQNECREKLDGMKAAVQSKYKAEDREHIEHLIRHLEVGGACPVCQATVEKVPDSISYMNAEEERQVSSLNSELEQLEEDHKTLAQDEKLYAEMLKGKEREPHQQISEELKSIKTESEKVSGKLKELKDRLERKERLNSEISNKNELIHEADIEIGKKDNSLSQLEAQLEDFKNETGFDDYNAFKSHMERAQNEAVEYKRRKKALEDRRESLNNEFTKVTQSIKYLKETAENDRKVISEIADVIDGFLNREPFLDREELREILDKPDMESKEREVKKFHSEKSSADMQVETLKKELDNEEYHDVEADKEQIENAEAEVEQLHTELAVLNNEVDRFQRVFDTVAAYIENYEKKKDRHLAVHELVQKISGNNHSKISLERYVLTYYLEKILNIANRRLLEMTNHRYALIRSRAAARRKTGLDIEVFDYYNNSSRHISSLSGGETFQASLSLALALSEAVQQEAGGISLDTMFIDEGFGTLDKETLEIAISTLIDLQSGGKTIGIISHVTELKERLHHVLEVSSNDEVSTAEFNL